MTFEYLFGWMFFSSDQLLFGEDEANLCNSLVAV